MTDNQNRARELRERLQLRHLNVEAGAFRLLGESRQIVSVADDRLPASNVIYLMLDAEEPVNYLQWLASDDIQILIEGGPADYYLFGDDGTVSRITMGSDLAAGQQMIVHAPAGTAKAIVLHDSADYLLVGSVVTPAWSPKRVRIGADQGFLDQFTGTADWATEEQLRKLIGPNFGEISGGDPDSLTLLVEDTGEIIFQGMQLSQQQAQTEIGRFAERHPGHRVTLRSTARAPQLLVEFLKQQIAENDLDLGTIAVGDH